ncbi:hypothetical protein AAG570_008309 [Ranatra chinensis]|uniref:Down syndrome cell adhesion molecule-like protein Dscam2 n=1 Tax=Ranatra chinensis TaxID=642074 RepID=A0ABD0XU77_9HEMI
MAPRIEHSEPTVRAKVGSQADLVCAAQGSPPPIYRWYKENDGAMIELHTSLTVQPLDSILKLSKIQHEDSGRYVCVASNILGEDRRQVSLVVNTPLVVRIRPHHQVVDGGSTATFNCSVEGGSGGHNLAWLKDGKPVMDEGRLRLLQSGEVLMVHNVKKGDAGMYQCLARSSDETEQSSSQLVLGSLSPELLSTFIEQTVQPGVSVSLSCRSSGTPPPRISWYLDGSSLLPRGGYMLSSFLDSKGDVVSYLNISHTRIQNGGQYTCSARNSVGIAEHSASLNVYGPPSPRPSQNLTAVSGGSMYIQCPIAGYPISSTTWLHRDQPINSKHHLYSNGTLLLKNIDPKSDKGEFSCTVRNQQGQSASNKIYVEVMKPPEIQEFQFPNNLQEGNRAHVSCTVISGDLPIEIMWYKNGGPISQEPDIQEQHHQFVSALLFSNLAARHSGHYTCIARNAAAQANFTAKLVVRVKPTWLIEPMDTAILYHNPALIHCQASGYPPPKINWERSKEDKPGEAVVIERDGHIHMVENGTIIIHSAVLSHKGHYTCEANNGIGTPIRKTIFLMVNVPAYFRIHSVNHSGMAGDSVYLSCEAEGDLPLRITWGDSPRGILPVPHVRHTSTGLVSEIHLTALSSSDAGKYHCSAHNDFGHDSMIIKEDENVVELTGYQVLYRDLHGGTKLLKTIRGKRKHQATLTGLKHFTRYEIAVRAFNAIGHGPPSTPIISSTMEGVPEKPPQDLQCVPLSAQSVRIRWDSPPSKFHNGIIQGYKIIFKKVNASPNVLSPLGEKEVKKTSNLEIVLHGLGAYTNYSIKILAFTASGDGVPSSQIYCSTEEDVPGPPEQIKALVVTSDSILVTWLRPLVSNGIIIKYNIYFQGSNNVSKWCTY